MRCQRCNSERIFEASAKHSDCFAGSWNGKDINGFAPDVDHICSGDYTAFDVCLDCGQIQGNFPVDFDPYYFNEDCEEMGE